MPPKKKPVLLTRPNPLIPGRLLARRNRFLADVELIEGHGSIPPGGTIVAHCPNTGAMEGLTRPGTRILLDYLPSPTRKLAYTWELAQIENRWIGTNTATPNRLVGQLLTLGRLGLFGPVHRWVAERGIGHGRRVDFVLELLEKDRRTWLFLEVKNCHLAYPDGWAYFPDCVSERASHHLDSLERLLSETPETIAALNPWKERKSVRAPDSVRSAVLYMVQIPRVQGVRPSDAHDPVFAETARRVSQSGVEFYALGVDQDGTEIRIGPELPVDLKTYDLGEILGWLKEAKRLKTEPQTGD